MKTLKGYPPRLFGTLTATSVSGIFLNFRSNHKTEDLKFVPRKSRGVHRYPPQYVRNTVKSRVSTKPLFSHSKPQIEK